MREQRRRERRMFARSVIGDLIGTGGEGDKRAGATILDRDFGKAAACALDAGGLCQHLGKRIVATGVEKNQPYAGLARHLPQNEIHRHGLEVEGGLVLKRGIDRKQVVAARNLQPVAGIEEKGDVGAAHLFCELGNRRLGLQFGEIEAGNDFKVQVLQAFGHGLGVAHRIGQRRRMLVLGVAEDQRNTAFGIGGRQSQKQGQRHKPDAAHEATTTGDQIETHRDNRSFLS